jgi:hypothetical protein
VCFSAISVNVSNTDSYDL